jgi:hypothetical protein
MKRNNKLLPFVLFAGLPLLGMGYAQASSELTGSATISFSIDNISNLTNPGFISNDDLAIFGSFEQDSSSYAYLNGDAVINQDNPVVSGALPLLSGAFFTHTFSINGQAHNGSMESYHLGLYGLGLSNAESSSGTYKIDLSFAYSLLASAAGQYADTDVSIEYFSDEDAAFNGSDYVNHANIFGFPLAAASNSGGFSIILAPGQSGFYLADVDYIRKIKTLQKAMVVPLIRQDCPD